MEGKRMETVSYHYAVVAPGVVEMFDAQIKFQGRNWRRIKRETNKAMRRARRHKRVKPETTATDKQT